MEFHPRYFSADPTNAFIENNKLESPTTDLLNDSTNRMTAGGEDTLYERQESVRDIAIGRRHLLNPKGIQFDNTVTGSKTRMPKRDARDLIEPTVAAEERTTASAKEGFAANGDMLKTFLMFLVFYYIIDYLF